MTALLGAYVLWRVARRLVPLLLVAGRVLLLLALHGHLPAAARQLRRDVQVGVERAQRSLAHVLQTGLLRP